MTAQGIDFAEPCYSMAIAPKTKGQEDKIASGLTRLAEEDLTFSIVNDAETKQMVISGAGDIQLDVICSKLKDKFGVEVVLSPARVFPTGRRSARRSRFADAIRSSPAATASSEMS